MEVACPLLVEYIRFSVVIHEGHVETHVGCYFSLNVLDIQFPLSCSLSCYKDRTLTHACDPISSVSLVTGTGEATRSVGTGSISVTVITRRSTLIYICHDKDIDKLLVVSMSYQEQCHNLPSPNAITRRRYLP